MRNQEKYNTELVCNILSNDGIQLIDNYIDAKTKLLCIDKEGYYIYIIFDNYLTRHGIGRRFDKSNDYSIQNINRYLTINNIQFTCISNQYCSANGELLFRCQRCGKVVKNSWRNVNKNDTTTRKHIVCSNCDGKTESIHAIVLKQLFLHYYPDTIVEDKSYINPLTNRICPTDIVNHRLKIAIEIQSQWHDFKDTKKKDIMKREYWINKGYKFYAPDIRDYSVLEMCQLFFNIKELPDWINYEYSNKLNIKKIQSMLNENKTVLEIAEILSVNCHRIYDAIYSKKLFYPTNYKNKNLIKEKHILQESSETAGCVW